ncbi:unnamed protein product [Closterium sp. NIES-65]|nr:unnamed protein product [Closterium sp. NIES-65]
MWADPRNAPGFVHRAAEKLDVNNKRVYAEAHTASFWIDAQCFLWHFGREEDRAKPWGNPFNTIMPDILHVILIGIWLYVLECLLRKNKHHKTMNLRHGEEYRRTLLAGLKIPPPGHYFSSGANYSAAEHAAMMRADRVRAPVMSASHKIIEAPFGLPGKRGHELWQSYVACHPEGMARFQQILAEAGHSVQDLHVHTAVALPSTPERECHYARANPSFHGMPAFSHAAMLGNTIGTDGSRTRVLCSGGSNCLPTSSSGCFLPTASSGCFLHTASSGFFLPTASSGCFFPTASSGCFLPTSSSGCFLHTSSSWYFHRTSSARCFRRTSSARCFRRTSSSGCFRSTSSSGCSLPTSPSCPCHFIAPTSPSFPSSPFSTSPLSPSSLASSSLSSPSLSSSSLYHPSFLSARFSPSSPSRPCRNIAPTS